MIPGMITMREAASLLGVSNAKMWRLVRDGVLAVQVNPLDGREKLIRRNDLEELRGTLQSGRCFVSDGSDVAPVDVPASRIKDWVRKTWDHSSS